MGESGIRAGWCALLFVLIVLVLSGVAAWALNRLVNLHFQGALPPSVVLLQESCLLGVLLLAVGVMARIEKRKVASFGYAGRCRLMWLVSGTVWGLIGLSVLVGILWRSHLLVFDGFSIDGWAAWKYAAAWAVVALLVGIFEESLFRGYLQSTLARGIGFWWAALLLSVVFALLHVRNGGESLLGLVDVGVGGLVFCLSLWYTKSLWWAIGFHAGWDWGQSFLYGTPDSGLLAKGHLLASHPSGNPLWSGGSTGPEGSLLILPLMLAMAAGMWLWWGIRRKLA